LVSALWSFCLPIHCCQFADCLYKRDASITHPESGRIPTDVPAIGPDLVEVHPAVGIHLEAGAVIGCVPVTGCHSVSAQGDIAPNETLQVALGRFEESRVSVRR